MSSSPLLPAQEQDGVGKLNNENKQDAKDKKGTLTNLFKKSQQNATKAPAEPEVIELLDDSQEGDQQLPADGMADVTPAASEDKDAQAQPAEEKQDAMEVVEPAVEQAQSVEDTSGDQADKKRKRPAKTPEQLAALEALFATDRYPSKEAKLALGTKLGLDLKEVTKWFEGRRRKDTRASSKRSRPDSAGTEPVSTEAAQAEEPAAPAPAATTAVPEQEQAPQSDDQHISVPDVEMVDAAQPPPAAAAPVAAAEPAPGLAEKTAVPAGTAAKAPAIAPPNMNEMARMIEDLTSEADTLRQRGLATPLTDIPAAGASPEPFTDARLAASIVGQKMPLTELVSTLYPLFGPPEGAAAAVQLTVEALRARIVDLAVRKSHDPVDNPKGAPPRLDTLEAVPTDGKPSMWQWELRDPKILPKAQRGTAAAMKRRAGRVGDRLNAVLNARDALLKVNAGMLTYSKASKFVEALKKYDTLEKMEAAEAAEQAAAAAKEAEKASQTAMSLEEKKRAAAEKEAEKERLRMEKEAEKERLKQEKEAEKERLRQEKEAEKEKARKEKEAEKEKKLKEAEAAKLAKKTGFADKEVLHKTANKFMSFFKAGAGAGGRPPSVSPLGTAAPSPAGAAAIAAPGSAAGAATTTAAPLSAYERRFPRPPPDNLAPQPLQPLSIEKIDSALSAAPISHETAEAEWKASLTAVATARRAASAAPPSGIGLPPSWARRPGAVEAAATRLRQLNDSGVDLKAVRTWRRKLIWFNSDSKRPPYYGSWPKPGPNINARRYLGKDETIDYEVMSDEDWEEEPEGSSLSGPDDEDDGPGEESEVEDSFMVADGYLSEDEGVRLDDDMDVDSGEVEEQMRLLNAATAAAAAAGDAATAAGANDTVRTRASQAMQVLLDRARRLGKPLVVVRQDIAAAAAAADTPAHDGCFVSGDPAALEAFAMEVLIPGISFVPPQDPAIENANGNGAATNGSGAAGGTKKKRSAGGMLILPPGELNPNRIPNDLIPELAVFITQNTSMLKSALIDAFIAAHPDRKITKKWAGEKITELAERIGNKWTLRPTVGASGAEATPAVPTGALDKLLARPHAGTTSKPTPAVPSALRPAVPASNLKAPERLVTTTAAGEAQAQAHAAATAAAAAVQQPLVIPEAVDGTGDDFWTLLLQHIEAETTVPGNGTASTELSFTAAFQPNVLARVIHALPAFILDALLMTVHRNSSASCKRNVVAAAVRSLRATVDALAHLERGGAPRDDATPSQKAWGEARSGSHHASLSGLCRESALLEVLKSGISGSLGGKAEEDAVAMVSVLLGCPTLKEISAENAAAVRSCLVTAGKDETVVAWDAVFNKVD